jgi:membrane-associated phospholipid phosphatase
MKFFFSVFCFIIGTSLGYSQSVYTYNIRQDIVIGSLSLGIFFSPFFVNNEPAYIPNSLEKTGLNALDRSLMFSYNKNMDIISDYSIFGILVLPALSIAGNSLSVHTLLTYSIMYAESFLLTFGTQGILKNAVIRYRPYMYQNGIPDGKENDYYNSFPSGATSLAFMGATFLSTTFSHEYPESQWKLPLILGSYGLAVSVASMRVASGTHFITDVFAGAAIGSFYGWIIPVLHKNDKNNLTMSLIGNGLLIGLHL